jgi:hypothetical protein
MHFVDKGAFKISLKILKRRKHFRELDMGSNIRVVSNAA